MPSVHHTIRLWLVVASALMCHQAQADVNQDIEREKAAIGRRMKMLSCIVNAEVALDRYVDDMATFTTPGEGASIVVSALSGNAPAALNRHLAKNLNDLSERHTAFWQQLRTYTELSQLLGPTVADRLPEQARQIHDQAKKLSDYLADSSRAESLFIIYLDRLIIQLESTQQALIRKSSELSRNDCGLVNIGKNFDDYVRNLAAWISNLRYLAGYIAQTRANNYQLLQGTISGVQDSYDRSVLAALGAEFQAAAHRIRDLLSLEEILANKTRWETELARGDWKEPYNRYLQYEAALLSINSAISTGEAFKSSIQTFSGVTDISHYLATTDATLAILQKASDDITNAGWQGALKRQIFLSERRRGLGARLSSACQEAVARHLDAAAQVSNVVEFRKVEESYKKAVLGCQS